MKKFYKKNIFYFAIVAMIALTIQVWKFQPVIKVIYNLCGGSDIWCIMLLVLYLLIMLTEATPIIQSLMWILWNNGKGEN